MAKISFFSLLLIYTLILNTNCTTSKCSKTSPCLCEFNEYKKIDISNLVAENEFITASKDNITYYFHGCVNKLFDPKTILHINTTSQPFQASLVLFDSNSNEVKLLGNNSHINYDKAADNDNDIQIIYKNETNNITASIRLICDDYKSPILSVINAADNSLTVSSPEVCVKTQKPGLSNGSILLILFLVGVVIYLVGGGLILYFLRGARGIEIIPNIDFWKELPGLVKDGLIFLLSGCRTSFVSTAETYDRI